MSKRSRDFIAALHMSLDGNIQGANGEVDWVDSWNDALDLISDVDAAVLGVYAGDGDVFFRRIGADHRRAKPCQRL